MSLSSLIRYASKDSLAGPAHGAATAVLSPCFCYSLAPYPSCSPPSTRFCIFRTSGDNFGKVLRIELARNRLIPLHCLVVQGLLPPSGDGPARGVTRVSADVLWWLGVFLSLIVLVAVAWIFDD